MDRFQNVLNKMGGESSDKYLPLPYEYIRQYNDKDYHFDDIADKVYKYSEFEKLKTSRLPSGKIYNITNTEKFIEFVTGNYEYIVLNLNTFWSLPFYAEFYGFHSPAYIITRDKLIPNFEKINDDGGYHHLSNNIFMYRLNENVSFFITELGVNNVYTLNGIANKLGIEKFCLITVKKPDRNFVGDTYLLPPIEEDEYSFMPSHKYRTTKGTEAERYLGPVVFDQFYFSIRQDNCGYILREETNYLHRFSKPIDLYNLKCPREMFREFHGYKLYIPKTVDNLNKMFYVPTIGEYVDGFVADDSHPTHYKVVAKAFTMPDIVDDNCVKLDEYGDYQTFSRDREYRGFDGVDVLSIDLSKPMKEFNIPEERINTLCHEVQKYVKDSYTSPSTSAVIKYKELKDKTLIIVIGFSDTGD